VPGELISDLEASTGYGDPLFGLNWLNTTYDGADWTQTAIFDAPADLPSSVDDVLLVFDSIKMAASVSLNGLELGIAADQFLRFNFSVGSLLLPTANKLTVTYFASEDAANVEGRFMACSGGWDWAPYSDTLTDSGGHTFSRGLLRDVYLVPVCGASLSHVVPHISYSGPFPAEPLEDGKAAPFDVSVDVVLWVPSAAGASAGITVTVVVGWATTNPTTTTTTTTTQVILGALASGETVVSLVLPPAEGVNLWWPLGMGKQQTTYQLNVTVTPPPSSSSSSASDSAAGAPSSGNGVGGGSGVKQVEEEQPSAMFASRSVGFRVAHLVTTDDAACAGEIQCANETGTGDHTMRFKVNGANVWARGSNQIPMEEMEGRER
jgi:hypothetical protein